MLVLGNYRLMNVVDFRNILCIGYLSELIFQVIPILIIQGYNNDVLNIDYDINTLTPLQEYTMALGSLVAIEIFFEILIICFKMHKIRSVRNSH